MAPDLAAALAGFPRQTELADLLRRSLDADGQVRDEASPALRRVRQRIRDLRRELVKRLEAYFGAPNADTTFQERYVTVRHGRYVLPIRAEAKSRLRGIVHDRSQSGATLFVEPEAMVEANNDLVQAAREEETEILRILAALTDAVRAALPELDALVAGIGGLDLIFARGALAERMDAVEPAIAEERDVFLPGALNPLLLAQELAWPAGARRRARSDPDGHRDHAERPLLVITGPNAGGKTVALKTLGLLALMAQAGCHVPARDGARLPVFSQMLRHRGRRPERGGEPLDVLRLRQAAPRGARARRRPLARAARRAGRGHRPRRRRRAGPGGAGGRSRSAARWCAASTHLEPLKGFASTHPRARNASVEFDPERLAPTFRLVYDRPGQSYALSIGARLGLPAALIERAHAHRSTQQRQLQELLARLDDRDRKDAERGARSSGARRRARACSRGPRPSSRRRGRARARPSPAPRRRRSAWSPRCDGT